MGETLHCMVRHTPRSSGDFRSKIAPAVQAREPGCVDRPMSTNTTQPNKHTTTRSDGKRFVALTDGATLTESNLKRCREPDIDLEANEHTPVFAVAYQHGLIQDTRNDHEYEGMAVLYLTADGEQAVEMWTRAGREEFERIERATVAPESRLEPTEGFSKRVAPVVNRHPEVN